MKYADLEVPDDICDQIWEGVGFGVDGRLYDREGNFVGIEYPLDLGCGLGGFNLRRDGDTLFVWMRYNSGKQVCRLTTKLEKGLAELLNELENYEFGYDISRYPGPHRKKAENESKQEQNVAA